MIKSDLQKQLTLQDTSAILQLNCHHSQDVFDSLFSSDLTNLYSVLLLQEPHVNRKDFLPQNQNSWTLISPTPAALNEKSRPCVCIYIRKDLNAVINPIHSESRDIVACEITIKKLTFLILNVYNEPRTFLGFEAFERLMSTVPLTSLLLPIICTTDSNLHSAIWNPDHSTTQDKAADSLVELMTKWSLSLRSPVGIPTFGVGLGHTKGTSIDLVWVNENFNDILQACFIDEDSLTNHFSDHRALITIVGTPGSDPQDETSGRGKNWNKVDREHLKREVIPLLPKIRDLNTREEIELFDAEIRSAVTRALDKNSPNRPPLGKHKAWWNPEKLAPLRSEASRL